MSLLTNTNPPFRLILGKGDHSRVLLSYKDFAQPEYLFRCPYRTIGTDSVEDFLNSNPNTEVIMGFVDGFGGYVSGSQQRAAWTDCLAEKGIRLFNILASHVDNNSRYLGVYVGPSVVIETGVSVGNHAAILSNCTVSHDCILDRDVFLGPGTTLCGHVYVGKHARIGAGVTVLPGIKIGEFAVVGAGSVVTKDVPDHAVVKGNPAKP